MNFSELSASHLGGAEAELLSSWYLHQNRELPWRKDRNPYRIWISEVMLQQTTVRAVIPYFERFMERFPRLEDLALAPLGDVLSYWSGLGYYSRARNLHRAAQHLHEHGGFQNLRHRELLELPGFGEYTARAVSSLAFDEPVGVLDGNVIRVLCRLLDFAGPWWNQKVRRQLQVIVDDFIAHGASSILNQALMELGATVCTPTSPSCLLCPLRTSCRAFEAHTQNERPAPRPRRERELWLWRPQLVRRRGRIALVTNTYAPFLKNQLIYPGSARLLVSAPRSFDYRHSITHHDIYVQIVRERHGQPLATWQWIEEVELTKTVPAALLHKALRI